jgi:CRP-like cAMP-binding protein
VLFADGDETYDLIVMLDGTAEIIQNYGQPGATLIAGYRRAQFLGEIGMLTGQRVYLTAVASSAGRVLAVPVAQVRAVMSTTSLLPAATTHSARAAESLVRRVVAARVKVCRPARLPDLASGWS